MSTFHKLTSRSVLVGMKTCSKCLVSKPFDAFNKDRQKKDGLASHCRDCHALYHQTPEAKEKARQHRKANADRIRADQQALRRANRDRYNAYARKDYEKHTEKRKAKVRERYVEIPWELQAYQGRYRSGKSMSDKDIAKSVAYRAAHANDPCFYCKEHKDEMQYDHVYPIALGGTDHWFNLVRACKSCNMAKGVRRHEHIPKI